MASFTSKKEKSFKPVYQIGIDLGGTKTEIILLEGSRRELFRKRIATPVDTKDNYQAVIDNIDSLVTQALSSIETESSCSIGIGIPGTLDIQSGIVQNANTTWLKERNFKQDLENRLNKQVAMANDANCFTLAESISGAAKGHRLVFGIIMGTGCGGGICFNRKLHMGHNGIAGDWGHFSIDPLGDKCFCGNIGCIDTKLTGPALSTSYKKLTNQSVPAESVVTRARQKEPDAVTAFEIFLDNFGKAVGGLVSLLDPDAIVIGGGLSNIDELYTQGMGKVQKYAFHKKITTPIYKNKLGDSAGVYGAAWLGSGAHFK